MEEHFRSLIDSLNTIPSYKKLGESSRGKFELIFTKDSIRMGIQIKFIDKFYPEEPHYILSKSYKFNRQTPDNIEELFMKSCYDEFIRIMLYMERTELVNEGMCIRCIPIADLIQYGIDKPKPESNE